MKRQARKCSGGRGRDAVRSPDTGCRHMQASGALLAVWMGNPIVAAPGRGNKAKAGSAGGGRNVAGQCDPSLALQTHA